MSTETLRQPHTRPQPVPDEEMRISHMNLKSSLARAAVVGYGLLAYVGFLGTLLYMVGFLSNLFVPKSIDQPVGTTSHWALPFNCLFLLAFGVQHSVMARPAFKRWWTRIVPGYLERSTFVLVTNGIFAAMFLAWQPMPELIWNVTGPAAVVLWGLFVGGLVLALISTFLIDHFELFGVRQVMAAAWGTTLSPPTFHVAGIYRYVRHPLMLGFLLAFWAAPQMSQGRLLFAAVVTLYVLVALRLEERDLCQFHGRAYSRYQRQVPMLIPRPGRSWQPDKPPSA